MRVLLVEDDAMIGEAIQGALKDASYATDWVKNGQTALTTLGCQHYDLIHALRRKLGSEVIKNVRGWDGWCPGQVISLTRIGCVIAD